MEKIKNSKKIQALFELRRLTACAMLIALYVVLNRFVSFKTLGTSVGFSIVAPMIAGMLYGPLAGGIVYGLGDLLGSLLFPFGPYHPGYTISAVIMGILLGFFLHPMPIHVDSHENNLLSLNLHFSWKKIGLFPNILIPMLINGLVLGLFLNTFWTAQLYSSKTYWGWFLYRLPQYILQLPVNVVLAIALLPVCKILHNRFGRL